MHRHESLLDRPDRRVSSWVCSACYVEVAISLHTCHDCVEVSHGWCCVSQGPERKAAAIDQQVICFLDHVCLVEQIGFHIRGFIRMS